MAEALLGVDLGTSGVKALVVALDGAVLGEAVVEYPVRRPAPGAAEGDPEEWWRATATAVRSAVSRAGPGTRVLGVGLAGQMHGVVLTGPGGRPTRPAVLWPDQRALSVLDRWNELPTSLRVRLANPVVPGMAGPLVDWLTTVEPDAVAAAEWVLSPKDWLRLRMVGRAATDPSDASATLLWDIPADRWCEAVLRAQDLREDLLPLVSRSAEIAGELGAEVADELGLRAGTPVAAGAADTAAGLLATGPAPGEVQLTVGTGAQLVRLVDDTSPASEDAVGAGRPVVHRYRRAEDTGWYWMAAVQNAGLALDWVRAVVRADREELADAARHGSSGGVLFVPHLTGERTPLVDPTATASLRGLRLDHDRRTVLTAAIEGVAFAVRHAAGELPGPAPDALRLTGGGLTEPAVRQLVADVLGVPLRPVEVRSAAAVGAAHLAAGALGLPSPPVAESVGETVLPGPRAEELAEGFARYREAVEPPDEDDHHH
ncbi:FGGY family carbohydrate kinase [Actinoalloteichus caeruleus]|uniref:FGGY family carbohydrate kinase n=1 Tax=Actinoalloteichus cyanogriseus TaxID=2893586 RepID=UPI00068D5A1A|nr:FGGY family carbohydrate kinase [Actinoalloteichus caeruleus]